MYRYIISYEPYMFKGAPEDSAHGRLWAHGGCAAHRYSNLLWDAELPAPRGCCWNPSKGSLHCSVFIEPGTGRQAAAIANTDAERPAEAKVRFELQTSHLLGLFPGGTGRKGLRQDLHDSAAFAGGAL